MTDGQERIPDNLELKLGDEWHKATVIDRQPGDGDESVTLKWDDGDVTSYSTSVLLSYKEAGTVRFTS